MKERINVAELLKDCPHGMELDCTMYDNCTFNGIEDVGYINILVKTPSGIIRLTKEGCYIRHDDYAKCVIFPKGKTTWKGFVPPCQFKDGDIITCNNGACTFVSIFMDKTTEKSFQKHCSVILEDNKFIVKVKYADYANPRFATEEEKEKLFKAIKDNGYKWNSNTKTLEKLIVPKFDISLLKPFDKVLVRDENLLEDSDITDATWSAALYSHNKFGDNACPYVTTNGHFAQCVPYKNNEHLLGTTDDCDEYYKTWD